MGAGDDVELGVEVLEREGDQPLLLDAAHRRGHGRTAQDAELADLSRTLHVLVVLGEHDRLVEAADPLVHVAANENAEAGRVRHDVLHELQVEVHDLAGEDVGRVALERLDLAGGSEELALLELGDGELDPVGTRLVVGVEEEDEIGGRDRGAGVAPGGRLAALDDDAPAASAISRVASVEPASATTTASGGGSARQEARAGKAGARPR